MEIIGFIFLTSLLIRNYIKMPEILGLSKDNPKVKTARYTQILFLVFVIGVKLAPVFGLDEIFSSEINEKIYIGFYAVILMYFGNILPRVPLAEKTGINLPCYQCEKTSWRKITKISGYLFFILGFTMFTLNVCFNLKQVYEVALEMIFFVLFVVSLICILTYYLKIIFLRRAKKI